LDVVKPDKVAKAQKAGSPASLATLSAHLGLSAAAISRVLNGVPAAKSIPKATQERIFAAAKQFNYRPNVLARSLRRGHSMTIGVLVPEVSEGYATLVLAGLEQGLLQAGYIYFLISHHHRGEIVESSLRMLAERSVDGMVAIDTVLSEASHLPTVTVSCPVEQQGGVGASVDCGDQGAEVQLGYGAALAGDSACCGEGGDRARSEAGGAVGGRCSDA
jgi:DNA-binding LacI/PurR family transcriptional regulator